MNRHSPEGWREGCESPVTMRLKGRPFSTATFTSLEMMCHAPAQSMKKLSLVFLLGFLCTGCATTLTTLTPAQQSRNANNLYPVEVAWDTSQRTIVKNTVRGFVIVGADMYPMQKTPIVKDRWETLIPVPPDQNSTHYKFKFEYDVLQIPQRRAGSDSTREYRLEIVDK
jgi:hypothetical protein